jgi:hypothetical protein
MMNKRIVLSLIMKMKLYVTMVLCLVFVCTSFSVLASPITGPTSTFVEINVPKAGMNDFHIVVDVTDGNPTIKKTTGKVVTESGTYGLPIKPTDNTVEKNGSDWTYKWGLKAGGAVLGETWQMGLELNHDNTMIIKDAFWTIDGIATNDKVPLPEWRVVGKEQGGQDPLAYILANPYDETLLIENFVFLLPSDNAPLALEDLSIPYSMGLGSLIPIDSFSLAPRGIDGDVIEFLFDGIGVLPLLDPGTTLAAEFFASMVVGESITVRTQHAVPEPATIFLLGFPLMSLAAFRKKFKKRQMTTIE